MHKMWLIIRREYAVRVRTRTFILSTIGLPTLMVVVFAIPAYFASRRTGHTLHIAVVDEAGGIGRLAAQRLAIAELPNGDRQFDVVSTIERPANPAKTLGELKAKILSGGLDGYLLIPQVSRDIGAAEFDTRNAGDFALGSSLSNALTQAAIGERLARQNVRVSDLDTLLEHVSVSVVQVKPRGRRPERGETFQAAILLSGVLYMSLLLYGVTTMRSILEEKSTRIIEILLSSVRPFPLLAGKILGVGAVGLTQFLIWGVSGALLLGYGAEMLALLSGGSASLHLQLPLALWLWFVVYFLGGYFLYTSLFAALGASVSSEQAANQAQFPITMLLVASFIMFPVVVRNPNSHLSVVLTMIPFFSPILMVLRVALEPPPLWQMLASVGILALTTVVVVYLSAKIYRVGVLMYGKRPSLIELVRWLRYT
ncbi:MAG TPA: ABC transporter permease [Patescibacteria group bacterium]|nr:ABC transporter permease [Patescibacteria group bacterium]